MSKTEPKKKTSGDDLPAEFRSLVRMAPQLGDQRAVTKRFKKGESVSFNEYAAPFIFEYASVIEATEEYKKLGEYNTPDWHVVSYKTSTARRAPSLWHRVRAWLGVPVRSIPEAKVVRR